MLSDFPSAQPPLARLLEAAPLLRPRLFSAASSQRLRGRRVAQLLVALVAYTTPFKRRKTGLCSAYLAQLQPAAESGALGDCDADAMVGGRSGSPSELGPDMAAFLH